VKQNSGGKARVLDNPRNPWERERRETRRREGADSSRVTHSNDVPS